MDKKKWYNKYRKSIRESSWFRYNESWGNYKSDKHKTKSILSEEIRSLLVHGEFSRAELIEIKDMIKEKGFSEFV